MADNRKRILVTGAAGLIGRELYNHLKLDPNNDVIGIDDYSRFPDYKSDVIKSSVYEFVFTKKYNDFDYIYHMAATNGTASFYNDPNYTLNNNAFSDLDIIRFAEQRKSCKLIYASSSEVVAGTNIIPTPETVDIKIDNIHNPRWSYRIPKIMAENYLMNSSINHVIIRFFNLFSEHSGKGHFVHDIIKKIKNDDFDLIGGTETRSFCYVSDAVPAIQIVGEHIKNQVVNIGSDEEIDILTAATVIANRYGKNPTWKLLPGKEGSVKRRCPDLTKLKSIIPDYNPRSFKEVFDVWTT